MEDAVHALIMAFSVLIFIMALSIVIYMFGQATSTAENLLYYSDETNYYDNIQLSEGQKSRTVDIDTVILTLYRYYKENFCVKIYDAPQDASTPAQLLQVFDVDLEGKVRKAAMIEDREYLTPEQTAYRTLYNDNDSTSPYKQLYMFEAPWIGSTDEDMKTRVNYYINGSSGYINNTHINYIENKFYKLREYNKTETDPNEKVYFNEEFIRYTYSGDTFVTEEGEILVEGAKPEDKIIIIYTADKYKSL